MRDYRRRRAKKRIDNHKEKKRIERLEKESAMMSHNNLNSSGDSSCIRIKDSFGEKEGLIESHENSQMTMGIDSSQQAIPLRKSRAGITVHDLYFVDKAKQNQNKFI